MTWMKIVIPSRGRQESITRRTFRLIPDALVCVDEAEVEAYAAVIPHDQLLPHPPLKGLPAIRNWIIENVPDETIFMVDDDILEVWSFVGRIWVRYRKPDVILQIIENAGECAKGIGAHLFGFSQSARPLAFRPFDPISLSTWIGTAVGVIGKDMHWDTRLSLRGDVDASLQALLNDRITYVDSRFHFLSQKRLKNAGGSTVFRSAERDLMEIGYLKRKWGRFIEFHTVKSTANGKAKVVTTFSPVVRVRRRQK
jgi:hypothetical protein